MRRATDVFAVLIAIAGFAVSYTTQALLAGQHGFPGWEGWLWPGIADAAALVMILRLHFGQVRPGWYTAEAWAVFALASTVAVGANAIADRTDPLGGAMHGIVPVMAMLVMHVVVHGRPAGETAGETAEETETVSRRVPARQRARRLVARQPDVTAAKAAERLGVSRAHAGRLIKEARTPHVVGSG